MMGASEILTDSYPKRAGEKANPNAETICANSGNLYFITFGSDTHLSDEYFQYLYNLQILFNSFRLKTTTEVHFCCASVRLYTGLMSNVIKKAKIIQPKITPAVGVITLLQSTDPPTFSKAVTIYVCTVAKTLAPV